MIVPATLQCPVNVRPSVPPDSRCIPPQAESAETMEPLRLGVGSCLILALFLSVLSISGAVRLQMGVYPSCRMVISREAAYLGSFMAPGVVLVEVMVYLYVFGWYPGIKTRMFLLNYIPSF